MSTVDASSMRNAGIVFDRDTFDGIDATASSYEGRLSVRGTNNSAPVGVAVTNSHFGNGGCSTACRSSATPTACRSGRATSSRASSRGRARAHVDSIQLYGSQNTQIVGNYFHDDDTIIMAPDGGENEVIADNVMVGGGYVPRAAGQPRRHPVRPQHGQVDRGDHGSQVRRARRAPTAWSATTCSSTASTNATAAGNCTGCTVSYNLFNSTARERHERAIGAPAFVGGANPTTLRRLRARRRIARQGRRQRRRGSRHPGGASGAGAPGARRRRPGPRRRSEAQAEGLAEGAGAT